MNVLELAQKSHRVIPIREGDYKKDGLWHCGICNTPKQFIKEVEGVTINAMCLCKCEAEKRRKEEAEDLARREREEILRQKILCFPSADMLDWNFENDDRTQNITGVCKRYVEHFKKARADGQGLLLYGGVGTGKTYMAACIANALIEGKYRVRMGTARNFADMAFDNKTEFAELLNLADLLILDDLSAERQTEYMQETVFQIVNTRYEAKLPLIVTTNLTPEQIKAPKSINEERIFSRLTRCFPVVVGGGDRRKKMANDTTKEWRDVLYG